MNGADLFGFVAAALSGHRLRTLLSMLGVAIGVTAVVTLTALGVGAREYVVDQFASLGTDLLIVVPGKSETTGTLPGLGGVPRDLTLDDAHALTRRVPGVADVAPILLANETISAGERSRNVAVVGTTAEFFDVRRLALHRGEFLPAGDWDRGAPVIVLGHQLAGELFVAESAVGRVVRIGEYRVRVVGVLAELGVNVGINFDDVAILPVASAQRIFDRTSLSRVMVQLAPGSEMAGVERRVVAVLAERHSGDEDFTLITQDALLSSFAAIFDVLTLAIAGIAAISLTVAGIGIMNVMLVSVSERTSEIGLLKAVGVGGARSSPPSCSRRCCCRSPAARSGSSSQRRCSPSSAPSTRPSRRRRRRGRWRRRSPSRSPSARCSASCRRATPPASTRSRRCAVEREPTEMNGRDLAALALGALTGHRLRSALSMLGIAIGIAAVILLTSIGEGTRRYVLDQFTQFGTNILAVNPGKQETVGLPGVLGGTTRKLTIDDAVALTRLPGVERVAPFTFGSARVEHGNLGRQVNVYGATDALPEVLKFGVRQGRFLPPGDPRRGANVTVLGPKLKRELFGDASALGRWVRIGGSRFRVIGVMEPKGQILGFDIDDVAYVPVASGMRLFNVDELIEVDVLFAHGALEQQVAAAVRETLTERHGKEDFTITTQSQMLEVFGNVMNVVTMGVAAIAGISLLVGAIGILTVMWIAVGERRGEIGLLKALGATGAQVLALFLAESAALATVGGAAGVAAGLGLAWVLGVAVPGLPVHTPVGYAVAAILVSLGTGVLSGVLPARRAAGLDPVVALRAE